MDKIEKGFRAFAQDRANKLAPGLDWTKPEIASTEEILESGSVTNLDDVIKRIMRKKLVETATSTTNLLQDSPAPIASGTNVAVVTATNTAGTNISTTAERAADFLHLAELLGPDGQGEGGIGRQKVCRCQGAIAQTHKALSHTSRARTARTKCLRRRIGD